MSRAFHFSCDGSLFALLHESHKIWIENAKWKRELSTLTAYSTHGILHSKQFSQNLNSKCLRFSMDSMVPKIQAIWSYGVTSPSLTTWQWFWHTLRTSQETYHKLMPLSASTLVSTVGKMFVLESALQLRNDCSLDHNLRPKSNAGSSSCLCQVVGYQA